MKFLKYLVTSLVLVPIATAAADESGVKKSSKAQLTVSATVIGPAPEPRQSVQIELLPVDEAGRDRRPFQVLVLDY